MRDDAGRLNLEPAVPAGASTQVFLGDCAHATVGHGDEGASSGAGLESMIDASQQVICFE